MNEFFTILYNSIEYSKKLKDFGTSAIVLGLQTSEFIYVGYRKPFNQFFVELNVLNTNANTITAEYYDGTNWVNLPTLIDESEGFTKSGFFFFDKPTDWAASTTDSIEKFYIRLKTDVSHIVTTEIQGLAILLSNDLDLKGVRSNIVSKFNLGNSWVLKHEQSRKDIIQMLRNQGHKIVKNINNDDPLVTDGIYFADITEFDLLQPQQLRQASLYKTISGIYLDELSDNEDDKWQRQGERYDTTFGKMFNLFSMQLDYDDDGLTDIEETDNNNQTALSWT